MKKRITLCIMAITLSSILFNHIFYCNAYSIDKNYGVKNFCEIDPPAETDPPKGR